MLMPIKTKKKVLSRKTISEKNCFSVSLNVSRPSLRNRLTNRNLKRSIFASETPKANAAIAPLNPSCSASP